MQEDMTHISYMTTSLKTHIPPEPVIFSGSKIMYMKVPTGGINIRLLDSLNFLPMPLAQLPKSFGLVELKKGFFPHYFNIAEHQNDVLLNLPDVKYYDPDSMSKERREEFFKWYEENKNKVFGFQKEMEEYCISDVDILLKALLEIQTFVEVCHWDKNRNRRLGKPNDYYNV